MAEEEHSLFEALQGFNDLLSERDNYRLALENIRLFAGKHRREPWGPLLRTRTISTIAMSVRPALPLQGR